MAAPSERARVERLLAGARSRRSPDRLGWIWAIFAALYALSVPWYLPEGPLRLWLGLPHWVVISLAAMLAVAAFTTWVARRCWSADEPEGDTERFDGEDGA